MSRGPKAPVVQLSTQQKELLDKIIRTQTNPQNLVRRANIIILAGQGKGNLAIAQELKINRETVRLWRGRWIDGSEVLSLAEQEVESKTQLICRITELLSDSPRPGAPNTFTPEQIVKIVAVACELPEESARPITHWTARELAQEAIKREIVTSISSRSVARFLDEADLKPHLSRYWLNGKIEDPQAFSDEVQTVCDLYQQTPELAQKGVKVLSCDEKTGIQALERIAETKPMRPGLPERREHSYDRHGTLNLLANFDVVTGRIEDPTVCLTRTEIDFEQHIRQTIASNPSLSYVFVLDQLNTHKSESLVLLVAEDEGVDPSTLGKKGQKGILKSMASRKAFLEDESHRIRFVYTPKHTSWLNQVEIWFSILVRKLLKRGSFKSLEDLSARILAFIDYFNNTMAKPFKWTFSGRPLKI